GGDEEVHRTDRPSDCFQGSANSRGDRSGVACEGQNMQMVEEEVDLGTLLLFPGWRAFFHAEEQLVARNRGNTEGAGGEFLHMRDGCLYSTQQVDAGVRVEEAGHVKYFSAVF